MLWYRGSIVIDDARYYNIKYIIVFTILLLRINQLEKQQFKIVSSINSSTSNSNKGKFELLLERSKILKKQEDYASVFAVVVERIYRSGYIAKIKESFVNYYLKIVVFLA